MNNVFIVQFLSLHDWLLLLLKSPQSILVHMEVSLLFFTSLFKSLMKIWLKGAWTPPLCLHTVKRLSSEWCSVSVQSEDTFWDYEGGTVPSGPRMQFNIIQDLILMFVEFLTWFEDRSFKKDFCKEWETKTQCWNWFVAVKILQKWPLLESLLIGHSLILSVILFTQIFFFQLGKKFFTVSALNLKFSFKLKINHPDSNL